MDVNNFNTIMDLKEIWKDIPNYEGFYQVSNLGNVKSSPRVDSIGRKNKGCILKSHLNQYGYLQHLLSKDRTRKSIRVHQLVAMTFLNYNLESHKGICVDHINEIKTDNRLENLQIITIRENTVKSIKHKGRNIQTGVSWSKSSKKWVAQIKINGKRKFLGYFIFKTEASEYYQNALHAIKNNQKIVKKPTNYKSIYKGVSLHKATKRWRCYFTKNSKTKHIGYFNTEIEAHNAYNQYVSLGVT